MRNVHPKRMYAERITAKAVMATEVWKEAEQVLAKGYRLDESKLRGRHVYVAGSYAGYKWDGRLYFGKPDGSAVVRTYYWRDNGKTGVFTPYWEYRKGTYWKRDLDVEIVLRYMR